ncbi:hypothetical protein [Weissella minor]|uniref:hypothetical protein n=1 Tax=Weissella minor TaxID=1620 RepID=UPI003AF27B9A
MAEENVQINEDIPALPLNFADPNSFVYRKYNKQTKLLVEGTDEACDSTDKIFATTKVALPDGDLNWIFREDIQMWKGYTAEQLDDYLVEIYVPTPTATDEWQIAMIQQNASLVQQNRALTQTTANLTVRVTKLEKEQMEGTNNG